MAGIRKSRNKAIKTLRKTVKTARKAGKKRRAKAKKTVRRNLERNIAIGL